MVTYRRIAMAIKTASKVDAFFTLLMCLLCPGSRWGNMEQVVILRHPEASSVAMDMLHWLIQAVLHPRIHMAIKMAREGATFVPHHQFRHQP
jgi:hypothetical protein